MIRIQIILFTLMTFGLSAAWAGDPPAPLGANAARQVDFAADIRPILSQHCLSCHGPDEATRKGKFRLDLRDAALAKKAIVPGDVSASKIVQRINASDATELMPPPESKKPLDGRQKQLLADWIQQGANYPRHWAFVPAVRPALADVHNTAWPRNAIDYFVLQRQEQENLSPSPEADKATLLRRVSFDLTGLPPTIEELGAFLADSSPLAYENVVDRLLASPRYGEHMALAWLDAARYADTNGYNNDEDRTMWPWRDWVINAFNQNMPYDRFIVEQLAGDLLPDSTLSQKIATAFLRNQGHNTEGGIIQEEYRVEYVADRVHTTATCFLGLSMQCARCHDHKFDPLTQKEYYRFYSFFNTIDEKQASYVKFVAAEPFISVPSEVQRSQVNALEATQGVLEKKIAAREADFQDIVAQLDGVKSTADLAALAAGDLIAPFSLDARAKDFAPIAAVLKFEPEKRSADQRSQLRQFYLGRIDHTYAQLRSQLADCLRKKSEIDAGIPAVMVMREMSKPRDTFVLKRGQYDKPDENEKVTPDVPAFLPPMPPDAPRNRLGLARWLVDPANPLTARVAVNRWWQQIFGTGLVRTVEDFGTTGETPSHPQLLDYLATELIRSGWDVKAMQRLMVLSTTYRQSSRISRELEERDPENRLLARGARYRLPAEVVRDQALAVSGLLHEQIGGPSVKPYQPDGLWEDVSVERRAKYVVDQGDGLYRRSLYTFWKRTCPPPALATFDAPNREVCVARRARTNTPLQALILLNDTTYVEASRKLAERVMVEAIEPAQRLERAFRRTLSRSPDQDEAKILLEVYAGARERFRLEPAEAKKLLAIGRSAVDEKLDPQDVAAWTMVCTTLLNLDETISKR